MLRPILTLAMILAGASAASAQGRAELLLSDAPQPEGRRCAVLRRLTAEQEAALDSAALRQAISADAALPREGTALYSVRMSAGGEVEWVRPIGPALPAAAEASVQAMVRAQLRPPRASEPWSLRVRVTLGETPEVRIGRSEVCAVAVARTGGGRAVMSAVATGQEVAELRRAGPARVRVRVGPGGEVRDVRLEQGSGSRVHDDMILNGARENRYLPELVDGFPVEAWYELRTRPSSRG